MTEERLKELEDSLAAKLKDNAKPYVEVPWLADDVIDIDTMHELFDAIHSKSKLLVQQGKEIDCFRRERDDGIKKMNEMGADYVRLSQENDKHRFENEKLHDLVKKQLEVIKKQLCQDCGEALK
jgi:hypothetical protein